MRIEHILAIVVTLTLLVIGVSCRKQLVSSAAPTQVSREQLKDWMDHETGLCILDVRSKQEYESGHIPGAININYTDISSRLDELEPYRGQRIAVYCRTGRRSQIALEGLKEAGFRQVYHLVGDMIGWRQAGLPTETGN